MDVMTDHRVATCHVSIPQAYSDGADNPEYGFVPLAFYFKFYSSILPAHCFSLKVCVCAITLWGGAHGHIGVDEREVVRFCQPIMCEDRTQMALQKHLEL